MYIVYILYSISEDVYHKGFTENLEKRIQDHNAGKSSYTSQFSDWEVVYTKNCSTKTEALKEEKRLKKLNRASLLKLIELG
jgi:putative endonuclease